MCTKEDIEKAKQYLDNEGYGTGSNFTLNAVANLMAEYAAKNCVIPAVMGELTCDSCGCHPILYTQRARVDFAKGVSQQVNYP